MCREPSPSVRGHKGLLSVGPYPLDMNQRDIILASLALVQLVLLVLLLLWMHDLREMANQHQRLDGGAATLRLPTEFVLREPKCADKLLTAMGIDNVRIVAPASNASRPARVQS